MTQKVNSPVKKDAVNVNIHLSFEERKVYIVHTIISTEKISLRPGVLTKMIRDAIIMLLL